MSRSAWMELLQWFGFVHVVVGIWRYQSNYVQGCLFSLFGCVCMAVWCVFTTPVPWGLFAVQVVCVAVWSRNYYHAIKPIPIEDPQIKKDGFSGALMELVDEYVETSADADLVIEELYERADLVCQWQAKHDG